MPEGQDEVAMVAGRAVEVKVLLWSEVFQILQRDIALSNWISHNVKDLELNTNLYTFLNVFAEEWCIVHFSISVIDGNAIIWA